MSEPRYQPAAGKQSPGRWTAFVLDKRARVTAWRGDRIHRTQRAALSEAS